METQLNTNINNLNIHSKIKVGSLYKHYSGKIYKVLSIANYSKNPESLFVVYQALYDCPTFGKNAIWCRPYSMFTEFVNINRITQPRFTGISEQYTEDIYHHSVKLIIKNNLNEILILKFLNKGWDLPGGRRNVNESAEQACKREVFEEAEICISDNINYLTTFPGTGRITLNQQQSCGIIYSFYLYETKDNLEIRVSEDFSEYKWVKLEESLEYLQELFNLSFKEVINRIQNLS